MSLWCIISGELEFDYFHIPALAVCIDEQSRMGSFVWSLWVTAAMLAFGILFIYQTSFLCFCFSAIYFVFLLYILKFNITMHKLRRNEE